MSSIVLDKPQSNQQVKIQAQKDQGLDLQFPIDSVTVSRSGDDLVFTFEDGGSIVISNYYKEVSSESIPDFVVEGAIVSGKDFFESLNDESLMPAEGPSRTVVLSGNGHFRSWGDSALADGVDKLGGLDLSNDWGWNLPHEGVDGIPAEDNAIPAVENFTHAFNEDGGFYTLDGNVLDGSKLGDGTAQEHGFAWGGETAQYGTITKNPDGGYTYELNNEDPRVQALNEGETLT